MTKAPTCSILYSTKGQEDKEMSECEKRGCSYYWQDETLPYPYCHYDDPVFPPPCEDEDEDYDYDDDVDESRFRYIGKITWTE